MKLFKGFLMTSVLGGALLLGACGSDGAASDDENPNGAGSGDDTAQLSGQVNGDGSSTVAPIMEAVVEEYAGVQPDVKVSVGVSGTGGGFEKFIAGETHFSNASRPIKDEEAQKLADAGVEFTELKLANDGLTVVINPENDWATELTVEQLKQIWIEDGTTKKWSDIDPSWPAEEIVFYSPGTDSGTYDYFNEVILEDNDLVKNATLSEDDNMLVQGVAGDKNAIGFFGYAYYVENQDTLKAVTIDGVEPNNETIESGEYSPLSRPLFVYVSNKAYAEDEAVKDFIDYTIEVAGDMADAVGYVRLTDEEYDQARETLSEIK